ncbi:MAG: MarR family transcriptional regulator [Lachnospiraceae bacterium]|nr:MarR family transcriptional regulator [Lachnospiraceae bacterium]
MDKSQTTKNEAAHDISKAMQRCNYLFGETEAVYHEIAWKLGLSDSAMRILYTICDHGENCPLQIICRRSGLSKQTVNSALRKLEAEGILYLEPAGAKNKNVCLTEAGRQLAEQTAMRVLQAENEIFASWPQADMQKYLELTERFLHSLQDKAKSF